MEPQEPNDNVQSEHLPKDVQNTSGQVHSVKAYKEKMGIQTQGTVGLFKPESGAKIIGVHTTYHRAKGGEVKSLPTRSARYLESDDDPIIRNLKIGTEWIELDTGWIKQVGMLQIMNLGGPMFNVVPTPEQAKEAQSKILEIGYRLREYTKESVYKEPKRTKRTMWDEPLKEEPQTIIPLWIVHVGECHVGKPSPEHTIYLRCPVDTITVKLIISPN